MDIIINVDVDFYTAIPKDFILSLPRSQSSNNLSHSYSPESSDISTRETENETLSRYYPQNLHNIIEFVVNTYTAYDVSATKLTNSKRSKPKKKEGGLKANSVYPRVEVLTDYLSLWSREEGTI